MVGWTLDLKLKICACSDQALSLVNSRFEIFERSAHLMNDF